jgi:chromosome segregation ATPase
MAIINSPKIKSLREKITLVEERVAFLEEKIDYNQDRQWTDYITLDPIKLVQNIFGGGDVQRTRLTIADLETKTSALSFDLVQLEQAIEDEKSVLREKIYNLLLEIQDNSRQVQLIESQLETFKKQKEIFKIQYAAGEGTTNQYLGLQDKEDNLNNRLLEAQIKRDKAQSNLFQLIGQAR